MATTTLGADSAFNNLSTEALAGIPTPAIADTIERLLTELDERSGDPDLETTGLEDDFMHHDGFGSDGPGCPVADAGEYAYPEWHTAGRHKAAEYRGTLPHEDREDDDPDTGVEDGPAGNDHAPGDPEDAEENGDREGIIDDDEIEQMPGDVPALYVYANEPNLFTGKRDFLGVSAMGAFVGQVTRLD